MNEADREDMENKMIIAAIQFSAANHKEFMDFLELNYPELAEAYKTGHLS